MLRAIGVASVDELFSHIPESCRLNRPLDLPLGQSEPEILEFFRAAAGKCAPDFTSFLGAGAYQHHRPSALDALISRGEWFTAYTPYQPEISQGTLQAIFEFQTMMCQLTGMEVANASMYDGSTATAEAVLMARRITGRGAAVAARSAHPHYREVLATYTGGRAVECPYGADGALDLGALEQRLRGGGEPVAAVVAQSPNFFGVIEDWRALAELAHRAGALLVAVVAEPVSLGLLAPPGPHADIVALEAQGLGLPVGFGGPYAGVLATREEFVRALPGRLAGEARDGQGRRGFVLTLSTREQHIRREKATSNICTNQALCALMASIFMSLYGRRGMRELAEQNLAKTRYLAQAGAAAGLSPVFAAPRFNEVVLRAGRGAAAAAAEPLRAAKIVGGLPLGEYYPELDDAILFCATETIPRARLDEVVAIYAAARAATAGAELAAAR